VDQKEDVKSAAQMKSMVQGEELSTTEFGKGCRCSWKASQKYLDV